MWRERQHRMAPPVYRCYRCFNRDQHGDGINMTVSPTAGGTGWPTVFPQSRKSCSTCRNASLKVVLVDWWACLKMRYELLDLDGQMNSSGKVKERQ